jgi:hypothetical protein
VDFSRIFEGILLTSSCRLESTLFTNGFQSEFPEINEGNKFNGE